jgi:hypothetical protein
VEILQLINWEQLGTAGIIVLILLYFLYLERTEKLSEREERKDAQKMLFETIISSSADANENMRTLDKAMDFIGRSK